MLHLVGICYIDALCDKHEVCTNGTLLMTLNLTILVNTQQSQGEMDDKILNLKSENLVV